MLFFILHNELSRKVKVKYKNIKTFNKFDYQILNLKSNDLKLRIIDIYGSQIKNNILHIQNIKDPYKISGFIGNLNTVKKSRGNQYIYINGLIPLYLCIL